MSPCWEFGNCGKNNFIYGEDEVVMRNLMILSALLILCCGCGKKESDNTKLNNAVKEFANGDFARAESLINEVLKNNPDNSSARLLQALKYEKDGDLDKALDIASAVSAEYPDSFAALYTKGRLQAQRPLHRRNAYETLTEANLREPSNVSTLILLCNLGTELKYKNVLQHINQLKKHPEYAKNNILNYQLGKCLLLHGKRQEALAALKSAVNGLSDFGLLFNIARTIDSNNLDRKYAVRLYTIYSATSAGRRNPAAREYARLRIRTLNGR
ncbi:MAG: tetratricopeptide repeat protein [Lentisphaerae bacterium]|nr:tetratricopeptide repeat protein [Lentisphaerota bacterium]